MKRAITALALCAAILLSATPEAHAAVTRVYTNITITRVTVHNNPGSPGSLVVVANVDICPGTNSHATLYNDSTNSADFKNSSAWLMAAFLGGKKIDIQVTSLDASPNLCRIEYVWIY